MIEIKKLTKIYGKQTILCNTDVTFPDKGLVCLLGASGCGKSTLFHMIAGFDSNYCGEIIVYGTSISKMNADDLCMYRRDNIGFVFQNYNLLTGYTVIENILLPFEFNNVSEEEYREKAKLLLKRLDMLDKEHEKIENLSGGQKQRVAIARALINNPPIILADEPTGALDRKNSTEIMELLKEISKDRLVLVITHDHKNCAFADSTVTIQDTKIVGKEITKFSQNEKIRKNKTTVKVCSFRHGLKNFKVHRNRYIAVSLAISIGVLAFILSMSSGNMVEKSMSEFKEKNVAFNNGYIQVDGDERLLMQQLQSDERLENVYNQYIIQNVTLSVYEKSETMAEKYPMPKAKENMSYGSMPREEKGEIALSPSLAKKFASDIKKLMGQELMLHYDGKAYKLTISGIFNAGYDDFFVSSDIEKEFYKSMSKENVYSISYDVKNFEDIVPVSKMLAEKGIQSETAEKEVGALQNTFQNINRLFLIVSILILAIGFFLSIIVLMKLQNSRYREIGLLSALGFDKQSIRAMMINENLLLSLMAATFNTVLVMGTYLISGVFKIGIIITIPQLILSILGTGFSIILISMIISYKLIKTEPAVALRK